MKKVLLFLTLSTATMSIEAQTIHAQNFNALTAGNLGTNTTGSTPGQDNYYMLNGTVADYQITTIDAAHGQSLKITAGSSFTGAQSDPNNHSVVKLVGVNATTGNNIIKMTYDFYTGTANGAGSLYTVMYDDDATAPKVIAALVYDVATKTIMAASGATEIATGLRKFIGVKYLGTTYPANSWVKVGIAYNMTTGAVTFQTPQENYVYNGNATYAIIPGSDIGQYRFYNLNVAANSVAYNWAVDDINVQYSNNTNLATNEVGATIKNSQVVRLSPNPTADFLNIKTDSKINAISVVDLSGRKMEATLNDNKVDVRNLPKGTYIINIETKEGKTSEKFIKQ